MTIIDRWVDLAGKHRVLVDIYDDGNQTMFKFDDEPTDEMIQTEVDRVEAVEKAEPVPQDTPAGDLERLVVDLQQQVDELTQRNDDLSVQLSEMGVTIEEAKP